MYKKLRKSRLRKTYLKKLKRPFNNLIFQNKVKNKPSEILIYIFNLVIFYSNKILNQIQEIYNTMK